MGYIPDSPAKRQEMLEVVGVASVDELFHQVPEEVRLKGLQIPEGKSELEVGRIMRKLAGKNVLFSSIFRGAGAYRHYIPAIVRSITSKEEFLTAYTPYQAEISQGVLQSIFEYQTQICELTGLDVSNASVYDGAVAAAEAVFMSLERNKNEAVVAATVNPETLAVIRTYCESRNVKLTIIPAKDGKIAVADLKEYLNDQTACLYVQSPNYYGLLEDVEALTEVVHEYKARMIMGVNPIALGLLRSPGEMNVDIAVGEGQPLGLGLGFGGPYLGFMACTKELTRRLPGRIVGQTTDASGNRCFVLTLQAREQHIRREKASSNICSNEALCAMTASVYLAAMGPEGLKKVAGNCLNNAHYLAAELDKLGFHRVYDGEYFNEFVTTCPGDSAVLERKLAEKQILMGLRLEDKILWCATEMNDRQDIDSLIAAIKEVL